MFACILLTITNSKHFSLWYVQETKPNRITAKDACKRYSLPSFSPFQNLTNVNSTVELRSNDWLICVGTYHAYDFWIDCFGEDTPACCDVVYDFVECGPLDLFPLQIGHGVHEIETHATLPQLSDEQFLLFR